MSGLPRIISIDDHVVEPKDVDEPVAGALSGAGSLGWGHAGLLEVQRYIDTRCNHMLGDCGSSVNFGGMGRALAGPGASPTRSNTSAISTSSRPQ
jgi:hypothetical protein